ncbi:MAG: UDP-N-acetylglucosamine 2-epimerase (hydrolyzing) [Acidiferrobacteraceae bacterium]|nr:UDP-N-acetylglucosamine 2-epimerase (hydrolyzing) [Acidiferrobacteraceae bacterium]|tara:strand:- start:8700 stop:9887 length:1188 start_codon:yes stop_codon:yes gene_type:complete
MIKKNVCVVTGSRAEYGLLFMLMKHIENSDELNLQVVATGMHLSPEFGMTYKEIENDGFFVNKKIEMLLSSDTPTGVSKSIGIGICGMADAFEDLRPDILVLLGDRFELLAAAISALIGKLPIAHIHGGEVTLGAFDEAIRHSITKMSHLHFTATEDYRNRVIQLGEHPETVFNVGGLGIDNIFGLNLLSRVKLEKKIGMTLARKNLLVTFHASTLEKEHPAQQFQSLYDALEEYGDANIIFTKTNADTYGRAINRMIDEFVENNKKRSVAHTSLGQIGYLSALKYVDAVVGNSSSGLLEAPSFGIGTINIGDRQKGRIKAASVIDCMPMRENILDALHKIYSQSFQKKLLSVSNPYGEGGASLKIVEKLKKLDINNIDVQKTFFDLDVKFTIKA